MRIAVVNCNTSEAMTAEIGEGARAAAAPGTEILALQPSWGPVSAEGFYDSFITAAAVLDLLTTVRDVDAVVMAGFGEHGREGARELLDVPVVDITEAAAMQALLLGHRYGIVTTLPRVRGQIHDSLVTAGLAARCAAIEATDLPVLAVGQDTDRTIEAFVEAGTRALAAGADVLCLGCAGFTAVRQEVSRALDVPVVDAVTAGVSMAEALVGTGLTTSKVGPYALPLVKTRRGWPVHSSTGARN
ncbi:aspartate/glutamate racemase family protein [Cellulomonas xiejunii]|uniref:Aspartate/glutamate racemase family protein n=1 Tax=Cellulomonas xiejunii TaxID=2968083 RepID=A0ABY5KUP3_9CELL|nr:aspartate/glutamate racemase family protein [Cellulomonas xiejunii]MCC2323047.1 aspartate/glutamate racemase family protein [Cellulomonas xiejunii]UUI73543.1 aspartate/glutamate racemase family protein [Cellulomonas xiejunii]